MHLCRGGDDGTESPSDSGGNTTRDTEKSF